MIEKANITKDMSSPVREYHFAGSGKYYPLTVTAKSREEAEKIWIEQRQEVKVDGKNNQTQ